MRWWIIVLGGVAWLGAARAELLPTERNAPPDRLKALAADYEQQGLPLEAASVYERLIEVEPASESILAKRLVQIYAAAGQADNALRWAKVVMQTNPEPQAYLAGVYTEFGNYATATSILTNELARARTKPPAIRAALALQLADVQERGGDLTTARITLEQAREDLQGEPEESLVAERLKHMQAIPQPGATGTTP